ncbi:type II toxin-antitoxin system RelE/ParE family toxin [Armatimonas rosea]|uniref:type II toxin-antitoxin system RelE/ParE family toxin n=1 Tax=Armatimonas rosea TaxID=685828 RepID=UPI00161C45EB
MSLTVVARQRAIEDLSQQVAFYKREVSDTAGQKLYKAAVQTFAFLADQPGVGAPAGSLAVPDLRRWRIKGYEKILIFYHYDDHNLYLIRILHGARDLDSLLDDEHEFSE